MPSNLAEAMIQLFDGSSNEGLTTLSQILRRGQHTLGQLWTSQLSPQSTEDLKAANAVLSGLRAQFEAAQPHEQRQLPTIVDTELLAGTTVNFPRSLVQLAWILQHAATLLPMAGDIQAVLNSQTAGVSDIHAWGLMLPSSSRVSPVTYHSVVAVRYPDLCRLINDMWELGSFASGGLLDRPPGFQFVLWDTNARINGLVATDLETLVSQVLPLPQECRVCRWALRNDHCNRSQEQPQPFSAQERLCPHSPCRNNSQLSRRNSTSSNRSPAEYWFPKREVLLQRLPYRRYGRLPWPNHCRTHPLKILNRIGLPARHDGAYGHGSGGRDHSIWHPRPSKRRNDMGMA